MSLIITKETANLFSFVFDGGLPIKSEQNRLTTIGNLCNFKSGNGANLILKQNIPVTDITLIASGTFTFTNTNDLFTKLFEVNFFGFASSGGSSIDRFDELLDTFSYFGRDGQVVTVNESQLKLETQPISLFTPADRDKLDGIQAEAEVNVQADASVTDPNDPSYIKNFPNIPDIIDSLTWIKSNESLSLAQRKGDVLYGILDQYTGEEMTLSKVTGTPTVDNVIFFQLGSEFFKRESSNLIDVRWFGAILDGTTDDTTALRNAFLKGVTYGYTIKVPSKSTMLVSDSILSSNDLTNKNLNVIFEPGCKINVSDSATNFEGLFYFSQASVFDINIKGNGVVINCNNKASAGFYLQNNSADVGGNCIIKDIEVINVYKGSSALLTLACQGVGVGGGFDRIEFNNVVVDTVSFSLLGTYGMEAKGIVAYQTVGDVFFINCQVNRVTSETGQDADGYAVFSKRPTELSKTLGKAFFINCNGIDNQGRHIKSQNSTTYISGGVFSRKEVISIEQGVDFDFQWGNGTVDNVTFIYEKNDLGVSPLGSSFAPIAFQNYTTDVQKLSKVINCSVQTEVSLNNFCILLLGGKKTTVELQSNTLKNIKTLSNTSSCISRCFVEFLANQVENIDFEQLELVVSNNNINSSFPLIGYTGASTLPNLYNKITVIADGNTAISSGSGGMLFARLSGGFIKKAKIISRNNTGVNCIFLDGWEVDTAELPANTNFSIFLDQTTLVNAPAGLGSTGFANIRTESESITGYIPKTITLDDGSKSYYTISGSWTRIINQTDLDLKANLASPSFTGVPTAPTPTVGTNTTQIANTAFVNQNTVTLTENQTINGTKTFSAPIVVPNANIITHAVNKGQLDAKALYANQTITANKSVNIIEFVNGNELILSVNATSGNITITLPTFTALQGYKLTVKKMDSSANSVLIQGVGGVNIDGSASVIISGQYSSSTIGANLSQYIIL